MTTVLPHVKIAWGGSLGTPAVEVWTNSIAWKTVTGGGWDTLLGRGRDAFVAQMAGLSTAISDWFSLQVWANRGDHLKGAGISPNAKLEWVKLNAIGADGKYLYASNTFFYPAAIPGGGAQADSGSGPFYSPPWQATTAITLRTTIARGRGSHGRIYPPLAVYAPDPNVPYQSLNVANQMCGAFTGLLDNFNSGLFLSGNSGYDQAMAPIDETAGDCCIVSTSPTSGPHVGAPALLTPILTVEVDRVPDVQTRRVNRVPRSASPKQTVTLNT